MCCKINPQWYSHKNTPTLLNVLQGSKGISGTCEKESPVQSHRVPQPDCIDNTSAESKMEQIVGRQKGFQRYEMSDRKHINQHT